MIWNNSRFNEANFLSGRSACHPDLFNGKSIAVMGCGSVGGFAAWMVGGMGASELILIDLDHLSESNLRRHVAASDDVCRRKVNACADFIASHLWDSRYIQRVESGHHPRFNLEPVLKIKKEKSPLVIMPIHCDILRSMNFIAEVFKRVDAVVVAVDDERVRYATAFLARANQTPTAMIGVYAGGWGCESILEGIDDSFACYGCCSASLGRVGVKIQQHRLPYVGQASSLQHQAASKSDIEKTKTAEPSVIHVSVAAAHGINALNSAMSFQGGRQSIRPNIAQRMRLPSMAAPPESLEFTLAPFQNEAIPVRRRAGCLECGTPQINQEFLQ